MSFWQGHEGVAGAKDLVPLIEKYIADQSLIITDGNRVYLEYYLDNPNKQNQLYQLCHKKGEFCRKEVHVDLKGKILYVINCISYK